MNPDSNAARNFYSALATQANNVVGGIYQSQIVPIQYSGLGDFNYVWQQQNQFNNGTFNLISACVSPGTTVPGTIQLSAGGGFPNAYARLVNMITFTLSATDANTLSQAQTAASAQASALVSTYQGIYGTITPAMLAQAKVTTPLDYVITYQLGSVWSCCQKNGRPPLTWTQMKSARNLASLLECMPASGEPVLQSVQSYLNVLGSAAALQDELNLGQWIILQLQNNVANPGSIAGMTTVDPVSGATTTQVAYGINKAVTAIQNDLNNTGQKISMTLAAQQSSSGQTSVSINGQASFPLVGDLIGVVGSGGEQYNLLTMQGAGQAASVVINFPGWTMVPSAPMPFQQANQTGWYYSEPIAEAYNNFVKGATNVTGFKFSSAPPFNLGQGGNFGQLRATLICNYPTITVNYSQGNCSLFQQSFSQAASCDVYLFGLFKIGSVSQSLYTSQVTQGSSQSAFQVTFTPSQQVLAVPPLQQTAFVLGGVVGYPATELPSTISNLVRGHSLVPH